MAFLLALSYYFPRFQTLVIANSDIYKINYRHITITSTNDNNNIISMEGVVKNKGSC